MRCALKDDIMSIFLGSETFQPSPLTEGSKGGEKKLHH